MAWCPSRTLRSRRETPHPPSLRSGTLSHPTRVYPSWIFKLSKSDKYDFDGRGEEASEFNPDGFGIFDHSRPLVGVVFYRPRPHLETAISRHRSTTQKRASDVLLRRDRSRLRPDPRRAFRPAHQGRGPLRGQEDPTRGAAVRAALSGHAADVET